MPIFTASALALAVAFIVLAPLCLFEGLPSRVALRQSILPLILQAAFGIVLFRVFLLLGLRRTDASEAGIVTSVAPAATALLAAIFLRERIAGLTLAGIGVTIFGVALANTASNAGARGGHLVGTLLVLCAVLSESVFNVSSKRNSSSLSPRATAAAVSLIAFVLLQPLCALEGGYSKIRSFSLLEWGAIAYYGIFVTALAYELWYRGVARLPASMAGAFSGLMPLSSIALSTLFLGERPSILVAAACAVTLAGVFTVSTSACSQGT
jgi:drug/metabolite transporter (DMT)-like permease